MNQIRIDGKTDIVTGARRVIGRAEALLLADRDVAVAVNARGIDTGRSNPPSARARRSRTTSMNRSF